MTEDLNCWSAEKAMGWFDDGDGFWAKNAGYKVAGDNVYNRVILIKDWTPLTDANQALMVVERMRELGWACHVDGAVLGFVEVEFRKAVYSEKKCQPIGKSGGKEGLKTHILKAAKAAREGE